MFAQMMASSGGGSVKTGTTEATTTASQEITIDTGLTQINKLVWFAKCTITDNLQVIVYDRSVDASKVSYASIGRYSGEYNVAFKAGNAYAACLKSISGGVVTIGTSTNVNYRVDAGYWFAQ